MLAMMLAIRSNIEKGDSQSHVFVHQKCYRKKDAITGYIKIPKINEHFTRNPSASPFLLSPITPPGSSHNMRYITVVCENMDTLALG